MSTIKDVANMAGVSISTVSNVITNKKLVSNELAKKVNDAIFELNYKVNPIASSLKSNKSQMIGVIVTSFKSVFIGSLLNGIQDSCLKADYNVCVYETNNNFDEEKKCLDLLVKSMVDGIIILSRADPNNPDDLDYIHHLKTLKRGSRTIPIVIIEQSFGDPNLNCVIIDNKKASFEAVQHLINLGHKEIGLITGPMNTEICNLRLQGYEDALANAHIISNKSWIRYGDFSPVVGYNCMRDLINETSISAVFAMNDQSGIGAIKAIKDSGLSVPNDIAVIGFDNIFPGTLISPSLSTVNIPKYQMGVLSVQRLVDLFNGKIIKDLACVVNHQIIVRKSTLIDGDDSWDLYGW